MPHNPSTLQLKKLNTNAEVQLEIITPLHIGTEENKKWFNSMDFLYQGGYIHVIDSQQLYLQLLNLPANNNQTLLDVYTRYIAEGKHRQAENLLRKNDVDISSISKHRFDYYVDLREGERVPNEIRPLLRSGMGIPMIPGSSIKGAIRSIIFNYLYGKSNRTRYNKHIESDLIGNFDRSIMRYIRPYDAELEETQLVDIDLFNLYSRGFNWKSQYKDNFTIVAESFRPNSTANFRLSIADGLIGVIMEEEKKANKKRERGSPKIYYLPKWIDSIISNNKAPIEFLFKLINDYTNQHLAKEIAFFKKYPQAEDTDLLIERLEELQKRTRNESAKMGKSCVLRMAYGSGFHAITGDWRFKTHIETIDYPDEENLTWSQRERRRTPSRYKSRKVADNGDFFGLMGFVELKT